MASEAYLSCVLKVYKYKSHSKLKLMFHKKVFHKTYVFLGLILLYQLGKEIVHSHLFDHSLCLRHHFSTFPVICYIKKDYSNFSFYLAMARGQPSLGLCDT